VLAGRPCRDADNTLMTLSRGHSFLAAARPLLLSALHGAMEPTPGCTAHASCPMILFWRLKARKSAYMGCRLPLYRYSAQSAGFRCRSGALVLPQLSGPDHYCTHSRGRKGREMIPKKKSCLGSSLCDGIPPTSENSGAMALSLLYYSTKTFSPR
jgi:hypothetical protein